MAAVETTDSVRLPPGPTIPKLLQGLGFVTVRGRVVAALEQRYGPAFTLRLPIFGDTIVIGDPALVRDLFTSREDLIVSGGMLGDVFGPGSTFSLHGEEHRLRRKLLVPPFHGKRMQGYEHFFEEEVRREVATWPKGREIATLQPMIRITLNAMLRIVFGAEGRALEELRVLLPRGIALGSRLAVLPPIARRDFGPCSPWGRVQRIRRRYDMIVESLIDTALADPAFHERRDVLSLLVQARYDDGTQICRQHIADELLTLLAAGHETTAATLAWAVERLRRHPHLLERLTDEIDAAGSSLLQATIWEIQRTRPVIDVTLRLTQKRVRLGEWVIPPGRTIIVAIAMAHASEAAFPNASTFDPHRYHGASPGSYTWIAYGGGIRRCIGAAFANMAMIVVLRTLLSDLTFTTPKKRDESARSRGVAIAPRRGGRAVVYPRANRLHAHSDASVASPQPTS